jgi:succinate-semialdehyde dehydrogenase/glutarate-semialdehyde dehydrogenase
MRLLQGTEGKLFINGQWVPSSSGEVIDVHNPANGETIGQVGDATFEDVQRASDVAALAFEQWKETTSRQRSEILYRAYELMQEHKDKLAQIITLENGKPLKESYGELQYASDFVLWYAEEANRIYGEIIPASVQNKRIVVLKQPVGVVGAITPWNFPAAMITRKVAPALAAGCTVTLKPATLTPLTAVALCQIFHEAGLPQGALNMVTARKASLVSNQWMADHRIRKITFTGSTEVGKLLMKQAADQVKKLSLELGGHAPLIVFDDADLDLAVQGTLDSKFRCGGQACIASNRIYVQEGIYEAFVSRFSEEVAKLKVGPGHIEGNDVGPIIDKDGLDKILDQIKDAQQKGAVVTVGGKQAEQYEGGYFMQPTVLTGVNENMIIMHEETFGPVAPIIKFSSEEEVVKSANNTNYGLASYIFSSNIERVIRVSEKLEFGIVGVNDGLPSAAQSPFGGIKESGLGREGSHHGLNEYLELKYISIRMKG